MGYMQCVSLNLLAAFHALLGGVHRPFRGPNNINAGTNAVRSTGMGRLWKGPIFVLLVVVKVQ
jgi:hypothetical protein